MPPSRFASTPSRAHPPSALRRTLLAALALFALTSAAQTPANLTAPWQPLGPNSILSPTSGNLTGRVTALALDPNDATGNTLYLGATGGGVWKSTNAAGPIAAVTFAPLTDNLPVFSPNAGTGVVPSLSIGALAVQPAPNPVLLAGTGDPNNATDSYYGEGILRSTDNGLTWSLIQGSHDGANGNHSFIGLSTAAIAFSTTTPNLVVAAFTTSPQSAIVNATNAASIPGLYYSTDAGLTWQMATIQDGTGTGSGIVQQPQPLGTGQVGNPVTAVVWNPLRKLFFAAVRSHGYYSSPDGITWTRLFIQPGTKLTTANCPTATASANCPIFRAALAVQPLTGDTYALTVDAANLDQGLWQDLCTPTANTCASPTPTFTNRIDNAALEPGPPNTAIPQAAYNLTLAAAPAAADSTILFAGTADLYRCAISANSTTCPLRNTTNALDGCNAPAGVFPAQHALAAFSQSTGNPVLFLGNDGGLWRSLDGVAQTGSVCSATDASHFDNLNAAIATGGSLALPTGLAQHPTDSSTLLIGLGAIGSAATTIASTLPAWQQLSAGEGGYPLLDPATPTNWYITIGAGVNLSACTLGGNCTATNFAPPATIGGPQVSYDAALLDAPNLLDPANSNLLLIATCRVWRGPAQNTPTWTPANALSHAFDSSGTPCTVASPLIRSLAAGGPSGNNVSQVIYAGLAGALDGGATLAGHLFVTQNANAATPIWTDTALPNPGQFDVSSLAVDPHDPTGATVYVTIQGFNVPHLYRSANFGVTWTNLSANLPNIPAIAVAVDPNDANTVYIALDAAVYVTQAITTCPTTNCWSVLGTALPNAPIVVLAPAPGLPTGDGRTGLLRAATYGRGLWQTPLLTATSPPNPPSPLPPPASPSPPNQSVHNPRLRPSRSPAPATLPSPSAPPPSPVTSLSAPTPAPAACRSAAPAPSASSSLPPPPAHAPAS